MHKFRNDLLHSYIRHLLFMTLAFTLVACGGSTTQATTQLLSSADEVTDTFVRATEPRPFVFPEDHGPHPEYQTEWWYYTGNLDSDNGEHFGYQLTFFRRSMLPLDQQSERQTDWGSDNIYMAHFAVTDVAANNYVAFERFARGAADVAGATGLPDYSVWLENWKVETQPNGEVHLYAAQDGVVLDLMLDPTAKAPVLQGKDGYSQKGPDAGNASYYYSLTRQPSTGTVTSGGKTYAVNGLSWMDHEFSTSALSAGQIGWDWFSLQLSDQTELMFFHIRRDDGTIDPFSSGTFVDSDGSLTKLKESDFEIIVEDTWRSPRSGGEYPAEWKIRIPSLDIELDIEPFIADQELAVSYAYWEGAIKFEGTRQGSSVSGAGYVEMTGYAGSMEGQF